jgi:hypothetical protein
MRYYEAKPKNGRLTARHKKRINESRFWMDWPCLGRSSRTTPKSVGMYS